MGIINTTILISNATYIGGRVNEVQQDPAVRKAWSEAASDAAAAARAAARAVHETREAWYRSEDRPPDGLVGARV